MTLVLGFKARHSVFITGDSAITTVSDGTVSSNTGDELIPSTSFFEKNVDNEQAKVKEQAIKTIQINAKVIAGYAGLVFPALDVLDEFKNLLSDVTDYSPDVIKPRFKRAVITTLESKLLNEIQLVIGFVYNDTHHLLSYNYKHLGEFGEHDTAVLIGSYREDEESALNAFVKHLQVWGINEMSILCSVNATLQSLGLHEYILEKFGIGGAFMQMLMEYFVQMM